MTDQNDAVEDEEVLDEEAETEVEDESAEGDAPQEGAEAEEEKGKEDEEAGEQEDSEEEELVIPVRSSQQHIIARQRKLIKRLRSEQPDPIEEEDQIEEDETEAEPDSPAALRKEFSRELAPLKKALLSQSDERELTALFATIPKAKKMEKKIRAYMDHPSYRGVAAEVIFHHLDYKNSQKTGAERKKAADLEADQTRSAGGSGTRPTRTSKVTAEDIKAMSNKQFAAFQKKQRQAARR